ncbi:MAG: flagellar motor switch protein FliN [Pirellulales bacterium]
MADNSDQIGQDEIENLLRQAQDSGGATPADSGEPAKKTAEEPSALDQSEIERLMAQGSVGPSAEPPADPPPQADEPASLDQDEIERLMGQGSSGAATAATATARPSAGSSPPPITESIVAQSDVELLLKKAEQALASIDQPHPELVAGIQTFQFEDFSGTAANTESATLELMGDVQLDLTIELGRTHMRLEEVLKLQQGTVVPLDKLAGDPADIYVNGRLVARGEVLVLNDNFCVRVAELIVGESACA